MNYTFILVLLTIAWLIYDFITDRSFVKASEQLKEQQKLALYRKLVWRYNNTHTSAAALIAHEYAKRLIEDGYGVKRAIRQLKRDRMLGQHYYLTQSNSKLGE
jgi:hypothetical protein